MNFEQRALIIGMSIGDGSIGLRKDRNNKIYTGHLQIIHSIDQYEYLEYKKKLLETIFGGKSCSIAEFKHSSGYNGRPAFRIGKANKYLLQIHRWLYSNLGKKYYTREILDKLTPHAIALWYMDDGCGKKRKAKDGRVTSVQCHLSTYCSEEEADCIIQYFKETHNIEWRKRFHKRPKLWYLECNTEQSRKLEKLIEPYIIPSMKYKLPKTYICTSAEQLL